MKISKSKKNNKNIDQAYLKCKGCGHTFWNSPCTNWGEVAEDVCTYCKKDEEEVSKCERCGSNPVRGSICFVCEDIMRTERREQELNKYLGELEDRF